MERKYVYFQPQYVKEFICDSSKCINSCCTRGWNIDVDEVTYKKYSQIKPESKAREIIAPFKFSQLKGKYLLTEHPCPFLTEKKLCRLQLEYGEDFLSLTCRNYPRVNTDFGQFFERSLTLTCSVAAEMILFQETPMKFELVEVSEKVYGGDKRIPVNPVHLDEKTLAHVLEMQIAMISILQERTLSINQRLIVLGFFLDRLDEIFSAEVFDEAALTKLIAAYESKNLLVKQVPLMLRSIKFDAKKFIGIMLDLLNDFYGGRKLGASQKFMDAVLNALEIVTDENNRAHISKIAANYERLSDFRKNFAEKHSIFLENFLVNELFMNCYPWQFEGKIIKNYFLFVIKYKLFELILFAQALKNSVGKKELISTTDWFCSQFDHVEAYQRRLFSYLEGKDDILNLMDSLLEP